LILIGVNIAAWLMLHLGIAWAGMQVPFQWFSPRQRLFRARGWEAAGRAYERYFGIRRWKDRLPDGAALFAGGFRKAELRSVSREYLERFVHETCRGEAVHWAVLGSAVLFFAWNPWPIGLVMVGYALVVNMPCILVQRYNRLRLAQLSLRVRAAAGGRRAGPEVPK